ncbi:MAG: rhodanese-like domain-containing protein [Flavobacteriaceae bacterium]|nr:rhodanese-like domain-containing protein [Flavobacteriaceae bacterium]
MKIRFLIIFLISFGVYSCKDAAANEIKVVTVEEMNTHLQYGNVQVVDLQPEVEYNKSHLVNAANIIYDKDFRKKLEKLDKTKPIAIYCTTGAVSPEAAKILQKSGFKNIYLLDGGIKKWIAEKREISETK